MEDRLHEAILDADVLMNIEPDNEEICIMHSELYHRLSEEVCYLQSDMNNFTNIY